MALSLVNAHSGVLNDLTGVDDLIRSASDTALYLVDGCQAVGQIPVDVEVLGCDVLTVTGRKWLRGPRGTGFVYVRPSVVERLRPITVDQVNAGLVTPGTYPNTGLSVRDDTLRFESWERSFAAVLGLSEALAIVDELGIDHIHDRIATLGRRLRSKVDGINGLRLLEPIEAPTGIVGISIASAQPWDLVEQMRQAGFAVGMMPRWENPPAFAGPTHRSALRLSPHIFNTEREIDTVADTLSSLATGS